MPHRCGNAAQMRQCRYTTRAAMPHRCGNAAQMRQCRYTARAAMPHKCGNAAKQGCTCTCAAMPPWRVHAHWGRQRSSDILTQYFSLLNDLQRPTACVEDEGKLEPSAALILSCGELENVPPTFRRCSARHVEIMHAPPILLGKAVI